MIVDVVVLLKLFLCFRLALHVSTCFFNFKTEKMRKFRNVQDANIFSNFEFQGFFIFGNFELVHVFLWEGRWCRVSSSLWVALPFFLSLGGASPKKKHYHRGTGRKAPPSNRWRKAAPHERKEEKAAPPKREKHHAKEEEGAPLYFTFLTYLSKISFNLIELE